MVLFNRAIGVLIQHHSALPVVSALRHSLPLHPLLLAKFARRIEFWEWEVDLINEVD